MTKRRPSPTSDLPPLTPGLVSLVGAGPGDPGLITVAGLERLKEADVIVYDRLAAPALLTHAKPAAELIYVGKTPGEPDSAHDSNPANTYHLTPNTSSQQAINNLLIAKARDGKRVVRLKGGDPFVFGRGGEEAEALHDAGVPFEIVPGVTSAVAVPAYAGIPVTHRGLASSFTVITGHEADGLDPANTYRPNTYHLPLDTLVFLMGVKSLPDIVASLIASGRSPDTPAAVIRWGTTPEQQTVTGTLADIVQRVEDAGITAPAITVVGEVVRLREKLSWFEDRPLFGKRVLITRTRKQASTLARLLAAEGAIPIELPAIEIEPTYDPAAVDAALEDLRCRPLRLGRLHQRQRRRPLVPPHARAPPRRPRLWASATRPGLPGGQALSLTRAAPASPPSAPPPPTALTSHGLTADLVPEEFVAESLSQALVPQLTPNTSHLTPTHILLPRAEDARPELPDALRAAGAEVDEVTLYRAAIPRTPLGKPSTGSSRTHRHRDLTSSSTVRNLAAIVNGESGMI